MAIGTVSGPRFAAGVPVHGHGFGGNLKVAYDSYDIGAAPADGDIIRYVRIPKGATVVDGVVYGEDIDTGTETLDFDIGWAANGDEVADPDGFGNFGVVTGDATGNSPVGVRLFFGGVLLADGPKTFNAETTIQIEFNAAANAGATGRLTTLVYYVMP